MLIYDLLGGAARRILSLPDRARLDAQLTDKQHESGSKVLIQILAKKKNCTFQNLLTIAAVMRVYAMFEWLISTSIQM